MNFCESIAIVYHGYIRKTMFGENFCSAFTNTGVGLRKSILLVRTLDNIYLDDTAPEKTSIYK